MSDTKAAAAMLRILVREQRFHSVITGWTIAEIEAQALALEKQPGDVSESAMEAWHSAVNNASELFGNAPDCRYATRASEVVKYLKAHRPLAAAHVPSGWQPISTAPMDGTLVLFFITTPHFGNPLVMARADDALSEWWVHYGHATHWQPLPPPPIAAAQGVDK